MGHLLVTIPVVVTTGLGFLVGFLDGGLHKGIVFLLISVFPAWLWWSIAVPRWRNWAKSTGADETATQSLAKKTGLVGFSENTELKPGESLAAWALRFTKSTILLVAFCFLLAIYGRPVALVLGTKWTIRHSPGVWLVPNPLPPPRNERSSGRQFSYFGYEFAVPWTELARERKGDSIVILDFSNGASVIFFDPAETKGGLDIMKEAEGGRYHVRDVFGVKATRSNYALRSKILYLTPADLSFFSLPREMTGNAALLSLKSIQTVGVKGAIYSFQTSWFHGFQVGGPSDKMAKIDAYDSDDREVEIFVGLQNANLTSQEDISRIIYSLRPAGSLTDR